MLKRVIYLSLFVMATALAAAALPPYPVDYPLTGKVTGPTGVGLGGREIRLYRDQTKGMATTQTNPDGTFRLNVFDVWPDGIKVGDDYTVDSPVKDGAEGKPLTGKYITGYGYDALPGPLVLTVSAAPPAGPATPETGVVPLLEPAPTVKLYFGTRVYQPNIYWVKEKGDRPFIVSPDTNLKVEAAIELPYTLAKDIESYKIVVDEGTSTSRTVTLNASNIEKKSYAAGTTAAEDFITTMSLKYKFDEPLLEGKHDISVTVRSSGLRGNAATVAQLATIEVMGGPLRVIGIPITFPSPYSIIKDGTVSIQYELSANGNVTVYLTSPTGEIVKKWNCAAGTEGGSAGVNKLTWDGRSDQGYQAGNAIYLGSIISRDENRLLAKYKLTVVN